MEPHQKWMTKKLSKNINLFDHLHINNIFCKCFGLYSSKMLVCKSAETSRRAIKKLNKKILKYLVTVLRSGSGTLVEEMTLLQQSSPPLCQGEVPPIRFNPPYFIFVPSLPLCNVKIFFKTFLQHFYSFQNFSLFLLKHFPSSFLLSVF